MFMIIVMKKKNERSITKNTASEFYRKGPHDINDNVTNEHLVEDKEVQFIVWLDANGSQSTTAPGSLGAYRTALKKEARH